VARRYVAGAAAGKDLAHVEAYLRRIAAAQEAEIAGPDAPILEKILAARIAVAGSRCVTSTPW
jgi:hypothetical protein